MDLLRQRRQAGALCANDLSPTYCYWWYHGQPHLGFLGTVTLRNGSSRIPHRPLITPLWLAQVWKFVDRFNIGLRDSEVKLTERRSDDQFLMVSFVRAGFLGHDLTRLNICRMFLHAITLADICTIDGNSITRDAWLGTRDPCSNSEFT